MSETCPECGSPRGLMRYADGSTVRHLKRAEAQLVCITIREAFEADDALQALEAYESVTNAATADFVFRWLTTKQRAWLKSALHVSHLQAGWSDSDIT